MDKPIWSWTNTLARLGLSRRQKAASPKWSATRRLRLEALEQRHLLSSDLGVSAFCADGEDLVLRYEIARQEAQPFTIGIFASLNGVTPDWLLATRQVSSGDDLAVGAHSAAINTDFYDPPDDYFLIAQMSVPWHATEESGLNHDLLFQGGAVKTADGTVHIHGTRGPDTLRLDDWGERLQINLNGALYTEVGDYSAIRIRGHGGEDSIVVHSVPAATASVWTFGGYGAELLLDGAAQHRAEVVRWGAPGADAGGGVQPLQGEGDPPAFLDPSFDGDGVAITDFIGFRDTGQSVVVQPDGKIVVAGTRRSGYLGGGCDNFAAARYNPDGSLDTGFGTGGKVDIDFFGLWDYAYGVALQSDGKILLAGDVYNSSSHNNDFGLVRYNGDDGSLDDGGPNDSTPGDSFGIGGKVCTDFFTSVYDYDWAYAVAVQSDGRIVAVGFAYNDSNSYEFALARYNTDGTLDDGGPNDSTPGDWFGTDGRVTTDFGGYADRATAIVVQPDDKLVVAGYAYMGGSDYEFAVARYLPDGDLDPTFGTGGKATLEIAGGNDYAYGVALQADGKIVVSGHAWIDPAYDFAVARFDPNGQPDVDFGTDGTRTSDFAGDDDRAYGVGLQTDGKIVVSGYAYNGPNGYDFALARYNVDGTPDDGGQEDSTPADSFGIDGKITTDAPDWPGGANYGLRCAVDADDKPVVAGYAPAEMPNVRDFMVARYLPLDIEITGFRVDPNDPNPLDPTHLEVSYRIWNTPPEPFDVAIYAFFDGQTPDVLLIDHVTVTETALGDHTVSISAVFLEQAPSLYDLEQDYFLLAKVDSRDAVEEADELNNTHLFDGGIFRDPDSEIVHVHGFDPPEYAARDIATLDVDDQDYYLDLLNPGGLVQTAEYADADVAEFHVRLHDGNDSLWTPYYFDPYKINQSGIYRVIWAFGGDGDDELFGGALNDYLYGGAGDDPDLVGRAGHDWIYGGPGNDHIEGNDGNDQLYGQGGDDWIEGWGNIDDPQLGRETIYGDYAPGQPGADSGDDGDDIITGGASPGLAVGEPDAGDVIFGGGGNDRIDGYEGDDSLYGDWDPVDPLHWPDPMAGAGNDEIYGWEGEDWIEGGPGDDNLFGEQDEDTIWGGSYYFEPVYYDGDDDWIFPDLYDWQNPPVIPGQEIDLVTDIDDVRYGDFGRSGIEPYPGSEDNREENGFYAGKDLYASAAELYEMQIYVTDPFHKDPEKTLTRKKVILSWGGDEELIKVYLDPEKTTQIHPGYFWTITDPWEPISIYVEAVNGEGTGVARTTMTLTLDPDPGTERPLSDFMFLTVKDDVA